VSSFYILDNPLPVEELVTVFSHSVSCFLILVTVSFDVQKRELCSLICQFLLLFPGQLEFFSENN
jgi:hypothetical protein